MNPERIFHICPTFENAILFLKDIRVHIPFETLLRNRDTLSDDKIQTKRPRLDIIGGANTEQIANKT
jgi:hypothetical protein